MTQILKYFGVILLGLMVSNIALADGPPPPPGGGNSFTIRVFLQGFYIGGGEMRQAHELKGDNSIAPRWDSPIAERITVELHTPGQYGQVGSTYAINNVILLEDGYIIVDLPTTGQYYLTIRTRNHLETVSAVPVDLSTTSSYNFTTSASQAFNNNQAHLGGGVYGIYAGDVNQDGIININDSGPTINSVRSVDVGYVLYDITGDGYVNINDLGPIINNVRAVITAQTPL
jgi:hypothetical protein